MAVIVRVVILMFIWGGLSIGGAAQLFKGLEENLAMRFGMTALDRDLIDQLIGAWIILAGGMGAYFNLGKMRRQVAADLGLGELLNSEKIEEVASHAIANGAPPEEIALMRSESAGKLAAGILAKVPDNSAK